MELKQIAEPYNRCTFEFIVLDAGGAVKTEKSAIKARENVEKELARLYLSLKDYIIEGESIE